MKERIKIALIDSGVNSECSEFLDSNLYLYNLLENNMQQKDNIGHGTSIAFILQKNIENVDIYSIKVFDKNYNTTDSDLIKALKFAKELKVNLVHISCGVTYTNMIDELHQTCRELVDNNIMIVSAYDNYGITSYPAAFPEVIGVFWDKYCKNPSEYFYVENSKIDILGYAGTQRLLWDKDQYKVVSGSSFIAPYITVKVAKYQQEGKKGLEEIKEQLKQDAKKVICRTKPEEKKNIHLEINNAITFPLNKEIHSIVGNVDLLDFKISHVADIKHFLKIGKSVREVVYGNQIADLEIEKIEDIQWDDRFDTIILGHTDVVSLAAGVDFKRYFLEKCIMYKKNLYCFDDLSKYKDEIKSIEENGNWVYFFELSEKCIVDDSFGSLNKLACPVVGVFGTSPKQGKFNIQLDLRRRFQGDGYKVGQLGTEPSSLLFGMDIMLPTGYKNNLDLSPEKEIIYINNELFRVSNKDIIIVGSQSQTIPYTFGNLGFYTFSQHNLLLASEPDVVVLCINVTDDIDYVLRTITYIESYFLSKVIALVIYPKKKDHAWNIDAIPLEIDNDLDRVVDDLQNTFQLPVFINGRDEHMSKLYSMLLSFFEE